jgi:hypothetical protein
MKSSVAVATLKMPKSRCDQTARGIERLAAHDERLQLAENLQEYGVILAAAALPRKDG